MGYQESLITTENPKDFYKLVERVKQLGKDYYEGHGAYIPLVITAKKSVEMPYICPAGTQFLYVTGERFLQRDEYNFLGCIEDESDDELDEVEYSEKLNEFDEDINFQFVRIFAEDIPKKYFYDKDRRIYAGMEHKYIDVEEFDLESEYMETADEVVFKYTPSQHYDKINQFMSKYCGLDGNICPNNGENKQTAAMSFEDSSEFVFENLQNVYYSYPFDKPEESFLMITRTDKTMFARSNGEVSVMDYELRI